MSLGLPHTKPCPKQGFSLAVELLPHSLIGPCLCWCCVDISCSDCYCWHCVAGPGLNYCSPVVCCCKTPQNWFATIKLYCKWVEAVIRARQTPAVWYPGPQVRRPLGLQPPHAAVVTRPQVSPRVDTDNLTLTSSPQTHSPPHSADTDHKWGRSRKYQREFWK